MRNWKILAVLMALAFVVPATSYGQSNEDLQQQIDELKSSMAALAAENAELKSVNAEVELEESINALAGRFQQAPVMTGADKVMMGGEFRFRTAFGFGDNNLGSDHDGYWTNSRVRINFAYEFTETVRGFAELQAIWTDGDPSAGTAAGNVFPGAPVRLYQGYLDVDNMFGQEQLSSRTGRQEFVVGNQFHFGNSDWYNGLTLDGTRLDWKDEKFHLVAFAFKLSSNSPFDNGVAPQVSGFSSGVAGDHDDSELYGLYLILPFQEAFNAEVYWVYLNGHGANGVNLSQNVAALGGAAGSGSVIGPGATGTYYMHALGARFHGVLGVAAGLDYNLEGTYQTGDVNGVAGVTDVDGFAVEAEVGITFTEKNKIRAFVRFLYASGPDGNDSGYIPLLANRHSNDGFRARYGFFDLLPMDNVINIGGGVHFDPAEDWTLGASFFYSMVDEDIYGAGIDDEYGFELDLFAEYRYNKYLTLSGGFSWLEPGDALVAYWGNLVDDDSQFLLWFQARLLF